LRAPIVPPSQGKFPGLAQKAERATLRH
jgi:hypothetical protein